MLVKTGAALLKNGEGLQGHVPGEEGGMLGFLQGFDLEDFLHDGIGINSQSFGQGQASAFQQ